MAVHMTFNVADDSVQKKRPSARPFYKDIAESFIGYSDLAGIYSLILLKVAWGSHTTKLRKYHDTEAGQLVTTIAGLRKLFGKDDRPIKRSLSILERMGVISIERRSKQCLVITSTNKCAKTAQEAAAEIPNVRVFSNDGNCHDSQITQTWQLPRSNDGNCHDSGTSNDGNCHDSNNPNVVIATIRPFPSLYEKKNGEEELIRREREEEPILSLLKKGVSTNMPPQISVKKVLSSLKTFGASPHRVKENKPLEPQDIIGVNWYTWALKNDPTLNYRLDEYISAVLLLNKRYPFPVIDKLLEYVVHSGYFAPKFLTPSCLEMTLKDGSSLIGNALAEMKGKKEGNIFA